MVVAGEVIWRASRTPEGIATLAIRETSPGVIRGAAWGRRSRMGARTAACALRRARRAGRLRPDPPSPHRRRAPPQPRRADRPHRRVLRLAGQRDHRAEGDRHAGVRRLAPPGHLARRARARADSATDVRPAEHRRLADGAVLVVAPRRPRAAAGAHGRRGRTPRRGHRTRVHERDRRRSARPGADQPAGHRARGPRPRPASARSATPMPSASATSTSPTRSGYALTGTRVDDDGMLELLAPWAGQRQRVIRLIEASGVREPRRAPRLHPEDHRDR